MKKVVGKNVARYMVYTWSDIEMPYVACYL